MLPEDQKRLERERDIAAATRGPDYRQRDADIGRVKAEAARRKRMRDEYKATVNGGLKIRRERGEQGLFIE